MSKGPLKAYRLLKDWRRIRRQGLFDRAYYLSRYPDLALTRTDPLMHYLLHGADEGRQPNPLFDTAWYRAQNPEAAAVGTNPLVHYILHPTEGGRDPGPWFDASRYLERYPDVAESKLDPLVHFLRYGRSEGRSIDAVSIACPVNVALTRKRISEMLPSANDQSLTSVEFHPRIMVIIPVYRGVGQTRRCLMSVLGGKATLPYEVLVVNDCSPEQSLHEFLDSLARRPDVHILENEVNQGFTVSVNRGIQFAGKHDVILLNSDTEVSPGWADRLAAHAYRAADIGTVTPFSNNASICSYPDLSGWRELPEGWTTTVLDHAFVSANLGRAVEIPTGVGFCLYIKRACLDTVGAFDARTFGQGYGEENDFCMRARRHRWRHLLAADTFVYHEGEVSFGDAARKRKERAVRIIRKRYPDYNRLVGEHVVRDPARGLRVAATAALIRSTAPRIFLIVTQRTERGTDSHLQQLMQGGGRQARFLLLRPQPQDAEGMNMVLELPAESAMAGIRLSTACPDVVADVLKSFGILRICVHCLLDFDPGIHAVLDQMALPCDFMEGEDSSTGGALPTSSRDERN